MTRSPIAVITVVGALGVVFAMFTTLLVARDERRSFGDVAPRVRTAKEPRVRAVKQPRARAPKPVVAAAPAQREPREELAMPDPRRESLVLNLDAYTDARSR